MDYHNLWFFERSIKNNRQMELEAERMSLAADREWFFTPVLEWLKERFTEMMEARNPQVKLVAYHKNKKLITACPIIVSPVCDEKC